MSFTDTELDQIRTYLGFPRLFISSNPFLESALQTISTYPEIVAAIRVVLSNLQTIETNLATIQSNIVNLAVNKVPVSLSNGATLEQDYARAAMFLRQEGQKTIQRLSNRLGIQPIRNYFYSDGIQANPQSAYGNPSFFPSGR